MMSQPKTPTAMRVSSVMVVPNGTGEAKAKHMPESAFPKWAQFPEKSHDSNCRGARED